MIFCILKAVTSFISDLIDLSPPTLFFLMSLTKSLLTLFIFLMNQLSFIDFSVVI